MYADPDADQDQRACRPAAISSPVIADGMCEGALENSLAYARRPLGGPLGLAGRIVSGLRTLPSLLWNRLASLSPECWL